MEAFPLVTLLLVTIVTKGERGEEEGRTEKNGQIHRPTNPIKERKGG